MLHRNREIFISRHLHAELRGGHQDEVVECETLSRYLNLDVVRILAVSCPDLNTTLLSALARGRQSDLENLLLSWDLQYLPGGWCWWWRGLHGVQSGPFLLDRLFSLPAVGVHFVRHGRVPDVVRSDGQLLLLLNGNNISSLLPV